MITEGIFDDIEDFNQACRLIYYTLLPYRNKDGSLEIRGLPALEEALTNALKREPRLQRVKGTDENTAVSGH